MLVNARLRRCWRWAPSVGSSVVPPAAPRPLCAAAWASPIAARWADTPRLPRAARLGRAARAARHTALPALHPRGWRSARDSHCRPIGPVPPRGSRAAPARSQLGSGGSSPPTKRLTNPLRPCASWVAVSAGESRGRGCGSQGAAARPHRAHSSRWFWSKEAPPGANCSRARSARRVSMNSRRETAAAHCPGRDAQRVLPTAPPSQREAEISHRL